MNYLKLAFYIIAVMCIVYAIFRPMDVLSWWWVKGKNVAIGIWKFIKGLF